VELDGKVALVTGAARGIGREIALTLAGGGANVAVVDIDESGSSETVELVNARGRKARFFKADVSSAEDVNRMKEEVLSAFDSVDILINNAGINRDALLMRMDVSQWRAVLAVNLDSVFLCTHAFLPSMLKKRWGRVVSISSVTGQMGNVGQANYAASKAGIIGFTKTVAKEVARRNITVNAIAPGFIETEMTAKLPENVREKMLEAIPVKRFGQPSDVANTVLFLCSESASYITGQVIAVNGGLYM